MKKKISLCIISFALVFTVFSPSKIYASTPILYSEFASDISSIEKHDIVISSALGYDMELNPGDVWRSRDTSTIDELQLGEPSKFGFIYYNYEIYYIDGTLERFSDTEVSYEELVSKRETDIKEVAFYYSYAGKHTINYKLDSIDGEDLKPTEELLGRVGYVHENVSEIDGLPDEVQLPDTFNIDTTLSGYHVKEVIGDLQGEFIYDNTTTTIIYEKDAPAKVNVSFDYNDEITPIKNIEVNLNDTVVQPTIPTRDGYTFDGWFTEKENGSLFDFATPISSNITLYAHWTKDIVVEDKYTVSFESNGGSAIQPVVDIVKGSTISEPKEPTKTGYTFDGWFKDQELTNAWSFTTDTVNSNITLYAKWAKDIVVEDKYTVSFETNGGSTIQPLVDIVKGSTISEPKEPTKTGYTFDGWFKDQELTNAWNFTTDTVNSNITLYAKWTKDIVVEDKYTVSFEPNGGSLVQPLVDIVKGSTISEPKEPTKTGYTFNGWFKDQELTNAWNFTTDTVNSNITLYAKWTKDIVVEDKYTVSFESNGGSLVQPLVDIVKGSTISEPKAPTKSGYTFKGWYVDKDLKTSWNFKSDKVDSNLTLYAKWDKTSTTKTTQDTTTPKTGIHQSTSFYVAALSTSLIALYITVNELTKTKKKDNY